MKTLLAVSPHLDDAIFSAGAALARQAAAGWRVVIATCFTASMADPQGFALACQLDKGLGPDIDYMALRRAEDENACAAIGAEPVHLPFPEAPHRGYDNAAALFGARVPNDTIGGELSKSLQTLIAVIQPDRLLGPAGIGGHVDHWLVREALEQVAACPISLWADLPYAARAGISLHETPVPLPCGAELDAKLTAARCYKSQLGFQFGSLDRMGALLQIAGNERFSEPVAA